MHSDDGIAYLQSLFDTSDELRDITRTLETLLKRGADRISLWTSDQDSRNSYSERAVGFVDINGGFLIDGDDHFDDGSGLSRGMTLETKILSA